MVKLKSRSKLNSYSILILLMMDIAKSETFKNFTILNKALLFSVKLNKTAVQLVAYRRITNHFFKISCHWPLPQNYLFQSADELD